MRRCEGSRADERGVTLAEAMVALFLVSVVTLLFYGLLIGTLRVNMMLESRNDLTTIGQRVVNDIKDEILQSRVLFEDDTVGNGYVSALVIPSSFPVLTGSELPVIDQTGTLVPDTSTRRTGNSLLVVRSEVPESVFVDHDSDSSTPDIEILADRYHFQYVYVSQRSGRSFHQLGYFLDLIQARSHTYADYFQLQGLSPGVRAQVASQLNALGITMAWDPQQPASQAFYQIGSGGSLSGPVSHNIAIKEANSLVPEFAGGRISGGMEYSVGVHTTPPLQTVDPINLFALQSGSFPSGFEVLVVGSSSSRKVLVRVVLLSQQLDRLNSHVNIVTGTTSEF